MDFDKGMFKKGEEVSFGMFFLYMGYSVNGPLLGCSSTYLKDRPSNRAFGTVI